MPIYRVVPVASDRPNKCLVVAMNSEFKLWKEQRDGDENMQSALPSRLSGP